MLSLILSKRCLSIILFGLLVTIVQLTIFSYYVSRDTYAREDLPIFMNRFLDIYNSTLHLEFVISLISFVLLVFILVLSMYSTRLVVFLLIGSSLVYLATQIINIVIICYLSYLTFDSNLTSNVENYLNHETNCTSNVQPRVFYKGNWPDYIHLSCGNNILLNFKVLVYFVLLNLFFYLFSFYTLIYTVIYKPITYIYERDEITQV